MTRKKPGPHPENPLDTEVKIQVDQETLKKIDFCKDTLATSRSEVLRKGAHRLYDELQKK